MPVKMTKEQIEHTHQELVCMFNSLAAINEFWLDRLSNFIEKRNYIGVLETTRDVPKTYDTTESLLKAKVIEISELLESHYEPKEPTDEELKELEDEIGEQLKWDNNGDSEDKPNA